MIHELVLFSDKDGNGLSLIFNLVDGEVVVDRSKVGEAFATEYSSVRTAPIAPADTTARIFIDNSVFEIFINDGEMVFSGRVFPRADQTHISILQGDPTGVYYPQIQTKKEDPIGSSFFMLQLIGESIFQKRLFVIQ